MLESISSYSVRDIRWTTESDFQLPAWNRSANWESGYEKLWLGSRNQILGEASRVSSHRIDSLENLDRVLDNCKKKSHSRVLVYIPVSIHSDENFLWFKVLNFFNLDVPSYNSAKRFCKLDADSEPHLAICLDLNSQQLINQTTILIPHWESIGFLELCLWSIDRAFRNGPRPQVLVVDDGSTESTWAKVQEFTSKYEFSAVQVFREDARSVPDVGALLDFGVTKVSTKYICMLDADTAVLNSDFVLVPLEYLKNKSVISVGLDTGLGNSYHPNTNWPKLIDTVPPGALPPSYFSVTNNLYRVMRTQDAIAVSDSIGFSRSVGDRKFRDQVGRIIRKVESLIFKSNSGFTKRALNSRMLNSRYPAMPPTCDNGVAANHWMDSNYRGIKYNIPITSYGVLTPSNGVAFQNISGLLVHIALSTRALSSIRREIEDPGADYLEAIDAVVIQKGSIESRFKRTVEISKKHKF